jgi:hypothetical protein
MARMKVEVTALRTEAKGLSLHDRLVAHLPDYAPYAAAIAPLIRLRDIVPGLAWLSEKITGFSARRPLPRWQRRWFRNHELPNSPCRQIIIRQQLNRQCCFLLIALTAISSRKISARRFGFCRRLDMMSLRPMPDGSKQPLCCGRTFLSTGMIDRARHEANRLG